MLRNAILPVLTIVLMIGLACSKQRPQQPSSDVQNAQAHQANVTAVDKDFMLHAAAGGNAEVELGQMAADKATNPDVKAFGELMKEDHRNAATELNNIAKWKQVSLPGVPPSDEEEFKAKLAGLSGAEFDRAYMQHMVEDHQKAVAEFKKAVDSASDPDVKQFAARTLQVIQGHMEKAQGVLAKLK